MFVGSDHTVIGGGRRDWGSMCFNVPGVESGGGGSGWWWGVASCKGCGNDGRSPIRTSLKGFGCGSTINCLLRLGEGDRGVDANSGWRSAVSVVENTCTLWS
jgi:hypothetical protein